MATFFWNFPSSNDIATISNLSEEDDPLRSPTFTYSQCKFYCECTPSIELPEKECSLWLVLESVPENVAKLDISIRFVCDEIKYDSQRRTAELGVDDGAYFSIAMFDTIKKSQFTNKSCVTFTCDVTIHEKFEPFEDEKQSIQDTESFLKILGVLSKLNDDEDDDDTKSQMSNVTYISPYQKVTASNSNYQIVLTYFCGQNKYWVYVEKQPFSNGHFKKAYKATIYKSHIVTGSILGTPKIADGTSIVLKVKHRDNAWDTSQNRPIMKREDWHADLNELERLSKYCDEWNKNEYSDKTYEVAQAFVLKVSDEGEDGTGAFQKGEYVLVEPYMPHFEKWNWPTNAEKFAKAYSIQAFGHFTYHYSNGREIVNDAQGYRDDNKYILTDPYYVDASDGRCDEWFRNHECNKFCKSTWKRPNGVQKKQLRANFAYAKLGNNGRSIRPTGWQ
eukprot:395685_1